MSQWIGSALAVTAVMIVVVVLVGVGVFLWVRERRRRSRQRDGEDTRTAVDSGAGQQSERGGRTQHPDRGPRSLTEEERNRYVQRWMHVQRHATGQPATALLDSDEVLTRLLDDIGYPPGRFVERAAHGAARHRAVVDDYRRARNVVFDTRLGLAGTAEIREATLRYRRVFDCLAETQVSHQADETAA